MWVHVRMTECSSARSEHALLLAEKVILDFLC